MALDTQIACSWHLRITKVNIKKSAVMGKIMGAISRIIIIKIKSKREREREWR
jgi:hypothetical protein